MMFRHILKSLPVAEAKLKSLPQTRAGIEASGHIVVADGKLGPSALLGFNLVKE